MANRIQTKTTVNTLAYPPVSVPPGAPPSTRDGQRVRHVSQIAQQRPRNDSLLRPLRKRAITLSPDRAPPRGLGAADSSNPVLLEMRKRGLMDFGGVLNQFSDLGSDIRALCDKCAEHIGRSTQLPRKPVPLLRQSPIGKPAHEFGSAEDYAFFTLLSIVNTNTCDMVFGPFHPALTERDSSRYMGEYVEMIDSSLQAQSANWRSQRFSSVDKQVNRNKLAELTQRFVDTVVGELNRALESLVGQTSFPASFIPGLESVFRTAYDWNRIVKKEVLKYDFEPYVVEPLSSWDPDRMESFERLETPIRPGTKVISVVSMGLVGSISLGGARVSHVQRKAHVLVEEWFVKATKQPGPARTMDPRSPPPQTQSNQQAHAQAQAQETQGGCCKC